MSETYSKNYFEKYAAYTLAHIFQIHEEQIILSDRPDLRIPSLDFGIEVTQALTPEEAVADMKKPLYASLDLNPFDHSHENIDFVFMKIHHAIKRKIKKSKNYETYQNNALYIFSHCYDLDKNLLLSFFDDNHQIEFYRYIYINCVTHIYCYDRINHTLTEYYFHKSELFVININSLIYEKSCSKKRRQIVINKKKTPSN